jgi:hypothetical protein
MADFGGVGTLIQGTASNTTTCSFTVDPVAVGDFILLSVVYWGSSGATVSSISGGSATWTLLNSATGSANNAYCAVYIGTVTSPNPATLTITASSTAAATYVAGQEYSATVTPVLDTSGLLDSGGTNRMPSLTPAGNNELYFCYAIDFGDAEPGSTPGYVYQPDNAENILVYNANCTTSAQAPTTGDDLLAFGIAVLIKGSGGTGSTATASLNVPFGFIAQPSTSLTASAALHITPGFHAIPSGGTEAMVLSQAVSGNVINDYGLDDVPFVVNNPGQNTILAAFIGWNVGNTSYQSSGRSPAVNVTDSAGNLWRQVGISHMVSDTRCALWVADNPRQTEYVSVALTAWGYSTAYTIVEFDDVPGTLEAVSLDFVSPTFNTAPTTSMTVPTATATGADVVLAVVATGGPGGGLTIPTGYTGIAASGGQSPLDITTYSMFIPNQAAGSVTFTPTWANSVPVSGIIAGLKINATAPTQPNPNFPVIQVEAAFGANPGNWTQSVDYTYDVTGIAWTNISQYAIGGHDDSRITTKRGRQYELSQEEAGETDISLDNHTGIFTFGNTLSPFYPNVVPGTPIRVTAWFGGTQYPIGFGYADKWPQEWPEMPQWGFSNVTATDAYGAMASTDLPSAVMGEIRKDYPYAYFPTIEQYEFTSQSLDPVESPIDANGLIAVNYAFGNNRFGAYRDGFDQPVTVGQALNLLGDENTTLGSATYTGQETGVNGPGVFYFDPNIPTNANGGAFSLEFWFVWGNTNAFACTYMTAWGNPSSFAVASTQPTNGGVITVGVNTPGNNAGTITAGFYVNGVEISQGSFNQTTFNPQHFVLTTGPNGTACYLNGVQTGTAPTLATIPTIRALSLGPACFAYDVSDMVVYDGFNYIAGHLATYPQELTSTMVANHYESGVTGFAGIPAPGRFAQILTWGQLGLKRGGTAWYAEYGNYEGTFISEAYQYDGSSAADIVGQVAQTEGGRAFTQANGSIVYNYRWQLYDQPSVATFGDSNITQQFTVVTNMGATTSGGVILTGFTGNGTAASTYTWGSTAPSSTVATWHMTGSTLQQGDLAFVEIMSTVATSYTVTDNTGNVYSLVSSAAATNELQYLYLATVATAPATITATGNAASSVASSVYGLHNFGSVTGSFTSVATTQLFTMSTNTLPFGSTLVVNTAFATVSTISTPANWNPIGSQSGNGLRDNISYWSFNGPELPYGQETSFAVDDQFIYNVVNATQQRGPNQDFFYQLNNFTSQNQFFQRSGLAFQSYALLPFDVEDLVTWSVAKYEEPHQRVVTISIDVGGVQALNVELFPIILALELNQVITVNRRPIGGSPISVTGVIQKISHDIGPAYWKTTLQITPLIPEANALLADNPENNSPGTSYLSW